MNSKLIYVAFFALIVLSAAHKYKSGECPQVEPMQGFDMRKVSHSVPFAVSLVIQEAIDLNQLTVG